MSATSVKASVQGSVPHFAGKKVWITGHKGMLGSAVVRNFKDEDAQLLLTSRADLDLTNQAAVYDWMAEHRPDYIMSAPRSAVFMPTQRCLHLSFTTT